MFDRLHAVKISTKIIPELLESHKYIHGKINYMSTIGPLSTCGG